MVMSMRRMHPIDNHEKFKAARKQTHRKPGHRYHVAPAANTWSSSTACAASCSTPLATSTAPQVSRGWKYSTNASTQSEGARSPRRNTFSSSFSPGWNASTWPRRPRARRTVKRSAPLAGSRARKRSVQHPSSSSRRTPAPARRRARRGAAGDAAGDDAGDAAGSVIGDVIGDVLGDVMSGAGACPGRII